MMQPSNSSKNMLSNLDAAGNRLQTFSSLIADNFKPKYSVSSNGKRPKKHVTNHTKSTASVPWSAAGLKYLAAAQSSNDLVSRAVTEPTEIMPSIIPKQRQNSMSSIASQGLLLSQTNWFASQRLSGKPSSSDYTTQRKQSNNNNLQE